MNTAIYIYIDPSMNFYTLNAHLCLQSDLDVTQDTVDLPVKVEIKAKDDEILKFLETEIGICREFSY